MALSEQHRLTLYNQLGDTVGDYEAVGALLSNIAPQGVHTKIAESEGRLTRYVH